MVHKILDQYLNQYSKNNQLQTIKNRLQSSQPDDIEKLITYYNSAIPIIEELIWKSEITDSELANYQSLFHEYEQHIQNNPIADSRYHFIIAIPVADRPQHLEACLNSILSLCDKYSYGGFTDGCYQKIQVLIADDSKQAENIKINQKLAQTFSHKGLTVIYFGQQEQRHIICQLKSSDTENITGNFTAENFYHKGASITRNITYLKLQQLQNNNEQTLYYFIDSDQEFQVNIATNEGGGPGYKEYYALNYFYYLNKLFTDKKISMLSGKVVGDPPVSPAVMAGTFLDDLILFIQRISRFEPDQACDFHNAGTSRMGDAAYHDMAELFGFKGNIDAYDYHCPLTHSHNNTECFSHFSSRLSQFFDGEHPTRKSFYEYKNTLDDIQSARTVYTGNYIFKPENLKYFIPFAKLKLRMAGPVLGRIIKAELGEQFISANLPMLHKRTLESTGQSEFRPGVEHKQKRIDLSGEFKRQFFGDVMLFSIIDICKTESPVKQPDTETLCRIIDKNILSMQENYALKHREIMNKLETFKDILNNSAHWLNNKKETELTKNNFMNFINNIEFNFGQNAKIYAIINSEETIEKYRTSISEAILNYSKDRSVWESILSKGKHPQ